MAETGAANEQVCFMEPKLKLGLLVNSKNMFQQPRQNVNIRINFGLHVTISYSGKTQHFTGPQEAENPQHSEPQAIALPWPDNENLMV